MRFNLFKSRYNLLKHASPAKPGKRFTAFIIDFVLVIICSLLVFSLGSSIVESTDNYDKNYQTYKYEIEYYENLVVEAHLVKENDDRDEYYDYFSYIASENIYRAINLNYETKDHSDYPNYVISDKMKEYGIANKDNDNLAYFYLEYVPNMNEDIYSSYGEYSDKDYLRKLYQDYFGDNFSIMFYDSDEAYVPVLKTDVAYSIWYYLEYSDKSDANETLVENGNAYYNTYQTSYSNMLENAEEKLYNSEPYYSTHYVKYEESVYNCARIMNITLFISIIVSSLLVVMLPKFLFEDEVTIGRKLMRLGVINIDNSKTKKVVYLSKSLIASIFYLTISIIISLGSLSYPIAINSSFSFGIPMLILALIGIINGCVCLFTHSKRTLLDIIFRTKVVDLNRIDEGDLDEKSEAMPY